MIQSARPDVSLDTRIRLFVAYIVDEKMCSFGDRWMQDAQIQNIQQWESKNSLDSTLSSNYGSCLEIFIQKELVYASSWTSYGNPREYTLFPSLQDFLFNCPQEVVTELQKIKTSYYFDLPFWISKVYCHLVWCKTCLLPHSPLEAFIFAFCSYDCFRMACRQCTRR